MVYHCHKCDKTYAVEAHEDKLCPTCGAELEKIEIETK